MTPILRSSRPSLQVSAGEDESFSDKDPLPSPSTATCSLRARDKSGTRYLRIKCGHLDQVLGTLEEVGLQSTAYGTQGPYTHLRQFLSPSCAVPSPSVTPPALAVYSHFISNTFKTGPPSDLGKNSGNSSLLSSFHARSFFAFKMTIYGPEAIFKGWVSSLLCFRFKTTFLT